MHILDAGYANDYIMPMLHFYVRINSRTENLPRFRHGKKSSKFGVDACIRIIKENGSDFLLKLLLQFLRHVAFHNDMYAQAYGMQNSMMCNRDLPTESLLLWRKGIF